MCPYVEFTWPSLGQALLQWCPKQMHYRINAFFGGDEPHVPRDQTVTCALRDALTSRQCWKIKRAASYLIASSSNELLWLIPQGECHLGYSLEINPLADWDFSVGTCWLPADSAMEVSTVRDVLLSAARVSVDIRGVSFMAYQLAGVIIYLRGFLK